MNESEEKRGANVKPSSFKKAMSDKERSSNIKPSCMKTRPPIIKPSLPPSVQADVTLKTLSSLCPEFAESIAEPSISKTSLFDHPETSPRKVNLPNFMTPRKVL